MSSDLKQNKPVHSSNNISKKTIEVGKFYLIHDGSKTGHPGLVVWKNDELNLYIAIKFGTSKTDDNIKLKQNLISNVHNYMYKRLFVGKRKDFGSKAFTDMIITKEVQRKFEEIKHNKFYFSSNVSKKIKNTFKVDIIINKK